MRKLLDKLASPNLWVGIASVLAVAGIIFMVLGLLTGSDGLIRFGMWLLVPLLVGAVILVIVVIPILIWANRRHRKD